MTLPDLEALSLSELFDLHARLQREFGRRGVARTSGAIQGEVGEGLALAVYGGTLPPPGTKAYDLIDSQGRLVQVNTRTLPKGDDRMFQFHTLDFDLALCMRFDRDSNNSIGLASSMWRSFDHSSARMRRARGCRWVGRDRMGAT